jgi:hypothetical protein
MPASRFGSVDDDVTVCANPPGPVTVIAGVASAGRPVTSICSVPLPAPYHTLAVNDVVDGARRMFCVPGEAW